jgi:hypothetical protein
LKSKQGAREMSRVLTNVLVLTNFSYLEAAFLVTSEATQPKGPVRRRHTNQPPRHGRARTLGPTWQQAAPIQYPARRRRLPVFSSRSSVLGDRLATSSYRCRHTRFPRQQGVPTSKDPIKSKVNS